MYNVNTHFDLNRSKKDFYGNLYMFNKQKQAQNLLLQTFIEKTRRKYLYKKKSQV